MSSKVVFTNRSLSLITCIFSAFRLIILCSNEGEDRSHIISCLHANRRQFDTITYDDKQNLKKYLNHHITKKFADVASDNSLSALDVYASSVDQDRLGKVYFNVLCGS